MDSIEDIHTGLSPETSSQHVSSTVLMQETVKKIRGLLASDVVLDPIDRAFIDDALVYIETPTGVLFDINNHATNIGQVIMGYEMQGQEIPSVVTMADHQMCLLQFQFHIHAVETELSQVQPNLQSAKHSLILALDPAKVLLRGYKDTTSIAKAQALEALIDHLLESGQTKKD